MSADTTPARPAPGKQLYRIPEAMHILSASRSYLYKQMQAGRLRFVHQGTNRLIPAAAIAEYVALLETEASSEAA